MGGGLICVSRIALSFVKLPLLSLCGYGNGIGGMPAVTLTSSNQAVPS